jgi:antitoxin component HigA of HigAB toxin-antitoxin module
MRTYGVLLKALQQARTDVWYSRRRAGQPPHWDRLDVLLPLVKINEAKRWPIDIDDNFDPIDVLGYTSGELGHTQAELAGILGSRSRASEILPRRRAHDRHDP